MNYRDKFYSKYVATQTSQLYGEANLENIKKQFVVWQKYFGRFLPENKNAKIIELGCGNGGFVYWLQSLGYTNARGVDISGEQVKTAEKLGIKNIIKADLMIFLGKKEEKYDIIFMRDVLEHFNKDEILEILDLVSQSLNIGGKVIIQAPNAENLLNGRLRYGDFTHEISFTESSMRQLLSIGGFSDIEIYGAEPVVHGFKSFIRYCLWKCIKHCLRIYLLIETGSGKGIFTQNIIIKAGIDEK